MATCFRLGVFMLFFVSAASLYQEEKPADVMFYVSPTGNDQNAGTISQPFATLQKAQTVVRARKSGDTAEVQVQPGTYIQTSSLVFDSPLDSNVQWTAVHSNTNASGSAEQDVTLSFGIAVNPGDWHKGKGNLWHRTIPEVARGSVYPRQLWDLQTRERLQRARMPNRGDYFTFAQGSGLGGNLENYGFKYPVGTLNNQSWSEMSDMEVVTFASWTSSRHYIATLNATNDSHAVVFTSPCGFDPGSTWPNSGNRFYAENAVEMVDSEGEWYTSRSTGLLTLYTSQDPNSRSFVLDRGDSVREAITVKAVIPNDSILIPKDQKVSQTTTFAASVMPWGNSSFTFSATVVTNQSSNHIFSKGPIKTAHVPNDKSFTIINGVLNLDMGWVGHLGKDEPGTETLITRTMTGATDVTDGKLHLIQITFDELTSLYTILVDGVVDAQATFGGAWDGDPLDWQVLVASDWIGEGYVSNVSFSGFASQPISNLRFIGKFSIEHVGWGLGREDVTDFQAVSYLSTAAVHLNNVQHGVISGMSIQHVGGMGLWIEGGSSFVSISDVFINDVGAGGLRVGRGVPLSMEPVNARTHSISVNNSKFLNGSNVFEAGNGVLLQNSPKFHLTHTEVGFFGHVGVTLGWVWGIDYPPATYLNVIENNHVHHQGLGMLSDLGGIYALGVQPGTTIRNNLVHDSRPYFSYGHGVYLDEGSSGITLENNWVHSAFNALFMLHYGVNNTIHNNVFAHSIGSCVDYQIQGPNNTFTNETNCPGYLWDPAYRGQQCSYNFKHNILSMAGSMGSVHTGPEGQCNGTFSFNVYHNASGTVTNTFPGKDSSTFPGYPDGLNYRTTNVSFVAYQKAGNDRGSVIADPRFVSNNPVGEHDFRVRADSPAIKLGFVAFDLTSKTGPDW